MRPKPCNFLVIFLCKFLPKKKKVNKSMSIQSPLIFEFHGAIIYAQTKAPCENLIEATCCVID